MHSFDSEAAMRQWLARIETRLDFTMESVDELKEHLLESIHELRTQGLDEEEAFLIASRRIGEPEALHVEFAKVENGARTFDLGIAVVIILLFVPALTTLVSQVMFWISIAASLDLNDWLSWRGLTICAAADLLVVWAVVRLRSARWRSGFDWFRRAALPVQVAIVLAAMIPSLAVWGSHLLASHMASMSTFGAATFAASVFTTSIRIVVIPALAIWLLVRIKRTGAPVVYTHGN